MKKEECYIEYLNASKGFKKTKKIFASYELAKKWGWKNLENYNMDMIKYSH